MRFTPEPDTKLDDDTSIQEVGNTLDDRRTIPLEDPHGLNHHYIYDEQNHENQTQTTIDIPRQ